MLPPPLPGFRGVIGDTLAQSTPDWPSPARAPAGSPQVVMILLDDLGFGQSGCYGGLIDTPLIDSLAARGLRYNNFHTTGLCSPSRAALRPPDINPAGPPRETAAPAPPPPPA
ncbi:MAG: hypothetical protein RJA10_3855 [Pseudomonadota bacterium]|jgi:arylsulfatase